jgi:hypothetical protein
MRLLRFVLALSFVQPALTGCSGDAFIAIGPDGGGSSGSAGSGSAGSGSASSGSAGSGSASSGTASAGSASSGGADSGSVSSGGGGSGVSGGSGSCVADADCPNKGVCGYLESATCSATGKCFPNPGAVCLAYSPGCACDGTEITIACTGLPPGYSSKPLRHSGACSTCIGPPPPCDSPVCGSAGWACPGPLPSCFTDTVPPVYKGCGVDGDCMVKSHQTDCCGTIHDLGVGKGLSSAYDACESAWDRHFPGCGCAAMVTTTEDGKTVTDPSNVTVHCLASGAAGGKTCQTTVASSPPDAGGMGVCSLASPCPPSSVCGFPQTPACTTTGQCFPAVGISCNAYLPGCACDGTDINIACNGLPSGYETKPLRHTGMCIDGG